MYRPIHIFLNFLSRIKGLRRFMLPPKLARHSKLNFSWRMVQIRMRRIKMDGHPRIMRGKSRQRMLLFAVTTSELSNKTMDSRLQSVHLSFWNRSRCSVWKIRTESIFLNTTQFSKERRRLYRPAEIYLKRSHVMAGVCQERRLVK